MANVCYFRNCPEGCSAMQIHVNVNYPGNVNLLFICLKLQCRS